MNIEGAEHEVLAGPVEMLEHTHRVVVAAYREPDGQTIAERLGQMLRESGFMVRIDRNLHVYGVRAN